MKPKIFIGPMSKNIVDTIIDYSNKNNVHIGLIPSRRQVEFDGGYVNNWTTQEFCDYVKSKTNNILLVRDHSGPLQGHIEDDGLVSFIEDCKYFDVIHVDVWEKHKKYEDGLKATIDFIKLGHELNKDLQFEVGTEESIRPTNASELLKLMTDLKISLSEEIYSKITYVIIQSGTALKGNTNIGSFNQDRLVDMIKVVDKFGLISKEHNGDYLSNELVKSKFGNGLDCINIAPEFGQIETKVILEEIKTNYPKLFDEFYNICYESKRWVKWVDESFIPENNKDELINISGHYVLSEPKFILLKNKLYSGLDKLIQEKVYNRINELILTLNEK
jgi:hypothetical protein